MAQLKKLNLKALTKNEDETSEEGEEALTTNENQASEEEVKNIPDIEKDSINSKEELENNNKDGAEKDVPGNKNFLVKLNTIKVKKEEENKEIDKKEVEDNLVEEKKNKKIDKKDEVKEKSVLFKNYASEEDKIKLKEAKSEEVETKGNDIETKTEIKNGKADDEVNKKETKTEIKNGKTEDEINEKDISTKKSKIKKLIIAISLLGSISLGAIFFIFTPIGEDITSEIMANILGIEDGSNTANSGALINENINNDSVEIEKSRDENRNEKIRNFLIKNYK